MPGFLLNPVAINRALVLMGAVACIPTFGEESREFMKIIDSVGGRYKNLEGQTLIGLFNPNCI